MTSEPAPEIIAREKRARLEFERAIEGSWGIDSSDALAEWRSALAALVVHLDEMRARWNEARDAGGWR